MAKRSTKSKSSRLTEQVINHDAAGIDIGATEIVVAVPSDRAEEPVRSFGTLTPDLMALRDWLLKARISTAVMESTGVFWVSLFGVLREAGIEVLLVNASQVKHCPARKTDVQDAQWLMQLHTAGLLRGSFHPPEKVRRLRGLMRERSMLVDDASRQLRRMQKALTEMNIQLHHVLSDIDGVSGLRIIGAILGGERDPAKLWSLRDKRCETSREVAHKALTGNWDDDIVARMARAHATWEHLQKQITELEARIEKLVQELESRDDADRTESGMKPATGRRKRLRKGEITCDIASEAKRVYGVDLETIPGVSTNLLATLMSEVGSARTILESFPSEKRFSSWLGLCPDNRKSGGKVLSAKTRPVSNRLATAFRLSAQSLWKNQSNLGQWSRKMKARLGKAEGITATAHRLARIVWHMIDKQEAYDDAKVCQLSPQARARKLVNLRREAQKLGLQLVEA
jgi:transposase